MKPKYLITFAVITVVALLGLYFPRMGVQTVIEKVVPGDQNFGASAGPERSGPCESINGVMTCYTRQAVNVASTTLCSIKSPSSTSTLTYASLATFNSTSSAIIITIARSNDSNSTSTQIGQNYNVAADLRAVVQGSTTPASQTLFAPNTFMNIAAKGGNGTFTLGGFCNAAFTEVD